MPGLSTNNEIIWEYINQNESEFLYYEIFINKSYFNGINLSNGSIVIDAGGNIGLFSIYSSSMYLQRFMGFKKLRNVLANTGSHNIKLTGIIYVKREVKIEINNIIIMKPIVAPKIFPNELF